MSRLGDDDVGDEGRFRHHDAPVEAQRAVGCATPPASALVTNEQSRRDAVAKLGLPFLDAGLQALSSASPVPVDVTRRIRSDRSWSLSLSGTVMRNRPWSNSTSGERTAEGSMILRTFSGA